MPRGIATLFLDGILVYHRLPLVFVRLLLQSVSTIFTPWRGEVLGESSVLLENMTQQLWLGLHFGPIDPESNWFTIRPSASTPAQPPTTPSQHWQKSYCQQCTLVMSTLNHEEFWFNISKADHTSIWIFEQPNLSWLDTCTCSWLMLAAGNELT